MTTHSSIISDYMGRGLLSARPAPASLNVATGTAAFYWATDVGIMYQLNAAGDTWQVVGGGNGQFVAMMGMDGADGEDGMTIPGSGSGSGASGANPTATASDTAVNGSAVTFMRSDAAPAIQKTSSSVFGLAKVDGSTITASGGVISAAAGALTLITETVTSSSATNVSFTSIAGTYRDLEVRVRGRGTTAANDVDIHIRFNADTGANYDYEDVNFKGSPPALSGGAATAATSGTVGYIAAASSATSAADLLIIDIGDYRGTTFQKAASSRGTIKDSNTAATGLYSFLHSTWWRNTAAITQIDIFPGAGAFVDGTVVSLYGRM